MDTRLRQAIARINVIHAGGSASRGTGFLVAPDLVLTAFHVVADRRAPGMSLYPGRIALTFPTHSTDATVVDGRSDPRSDWILLRCVTPPPHVQPIPLADRVEDGASWETFGFPEANRRDGMVHIGTVDNASGTFEGVPAHQLFSRQAAAGTGAPVKGLSGGPVIIEGAVVGLLRSSLMRDGQNVAGTLYGCPIDVILECCEDLLPIPDPCRGLPGFARRPLPATPFRFLERFTSRDAEIFLGRNQEIRQLYNDVISESGAGVILLYGQSGAGKSSFLDAGLLPRLETTHTTVYLRRDRSKGLVATLVEGISRATMPVAGEAPLFLLSPTEAIRLAWLAAERTTRRPLVVVLDQVEEVFTLPADDPNELSSFVDALVQLFRAPAVPRGRLVLGFRKEWLAELQEIFNQRQLDYSKMFLEALRSDAVVEIVKGLQGTARLRNRYRLEVEPLLADAIARDMTSDRNSPIAPILQVLLSRMWRAATDESGSKPCFTLTLYERLRDEGFRLTDFLDQQLGALTRAAATAGGSVIDVVESGLALDVLRFHTSELGTARNRSAEDLCAEYERDADVEWLVRELKALYLLSEPAGETRNLSGTTRLAHDTLAAAVQARFEESDRPGQRARRIIESRAAEWSQGRIGTPLDARDLTVAQQGLAGTRAPRLDEDRLLRASQAACDLDDAQNAAAAGKVAPALAFLARALRQDADNVSARAWAFNYLASVPRLQLQLRHRRGVTAAAFSLDGTRVVTASWDGTARVWDACSGMAIGPPMEHQDGVFAAAFSPDGTRVVTASRDKTARVWNARTAQAVGAPLQHQDWVRTAAFSPDGTRVVTASTDNTARVWDSSTGQAVGAPLQHQDALSGAAFSPDGTRVVTASDDKTARVWDASTGQAVGAPLQHQDPVRTAAFSPDGTRVVTASADHAARIWDACTGQAVGAPLQHSAWIYEAAFSPDGTRVVTASDDKTARVWNARTGRAVGAPLLHQDVVSAAAFSPDGARVVTASRDTTARVWNARTGQAVGAPLPHQGSVGAAAFSPDGTRVLTASADGARVWDARTGQAVGAPLQHQDALSGAAFSRDGTRLVTASADGTARVWDAHTGQAVGAPLQHQGALRGAAFSRDGTRVVTTTADTARIWDARTGQAVAVFTPPELAFPGELSLSSDGTRLVNRPLDVPARIWDVRTGQAVGVPLQHQDEVMHAEFSPDGTRVVTASTDNTARVWDASTGQAVGPPLQHQDSVYSAAFSPDGTRVVTASTDNTARVWDASTGQAVGPPLQHQDEVLTAAFSPDGTRMVTISADMSARVWDLHTGQAVGPPLRHPRRVNAAALSMDGTRVVTATADTTAQVWDARTGQAVGGPLRHQGPVIAAAFSPDGAQVLTASEDRTARLWDAQVGTADDSAMLADFAEAMGGVRVSLAGAIEPIDDVNVRLEALRQQAIGAEAGKPGAASFIRWFFDDPWSRTTSPLSKMTVDEYIERMLAMGDDGRAEVERVFLGHPGLKQASR